MHFLQPVDGPTAAASRRRSGITKRREKWATKIHSSTVVFAEIKPSFLKLKGHPSVDVFFATLQSAVHLVDPNPNIMMAVGKLRDSVPTNPSDAKTQNRRSIGLGDAIHLQTCLHIRDVLKVTDVVFQTFDDGKGKNWEGRCVPLLTFERWFPDPKNKMVSDVCGLVRQLPRSSQQSLFATGIGYTSVALITDGSNQGKPSS